MPRYDRLLGLLAMLFIAAVSTSCRHATSETPAPSAPEVTVSQPIEREITDPLDFTGRMEAVDSVEIRARVSGHLSKIYFKPGAEVKKGDPLFLIDPRPYESVLKKAQSQVAVVEARIARLTTELARADKLMASNAMAREDYDKIAGDLAEARASLQAAKAVADSAALDVGWTKVTSPMDGQVNRNLISVGNLVAADTTLLTDIVSVEPMFAYFDLNERELLRLQKLAREGKLHGTGNGKGNDHKAEILLALANDEGYPHRGAVDFVGTKVSTSTGTMEVRATFPNPKLPNGDRLFTPGLFVRLRLPLGKPYQALLIPAEAIGQDQDQKYVLVLDDKDMVRYRRVKLGRLDGDLQVVQEGLKPGDWVIVNGLQRTRPGEVVKPQRTTINEKKTTAPDVSVSKSK